MDNGSCVLYKIILFDLLLQFQPIHFHSYSCANVFDLSPIVLSILNAIPYQVQYIIEMLSSLHFYITVFIRMYILKCDGMYTIALTIL